MKKLTQIVLTILLGSVAFAILPFSFLAFFILLGQDNSVSDQDIFSLEIFGALLLCIGGIIGICVSFIQASLVKSAIIGASVGVTFWIIGVRDVSKIGLSVLFLYLLSGTATGLVCGIFVNRTVTNQKIQRMVN